MGRKSGLVLAGWFSWIAIATWFGVPALARLFSDTCESCIASISYESRLDPTLGDQILPAPVVKWIAHMPPQVTSVLCVAAGSCQSCTVNKLNGGRTVQAPGRVTILVVPGDSTRVEMPTKGLYFDRVLILDYFGFEHLNVRWYPRLMSVDRNGRLLALQSKGESVENFLVRAKA